MLHCSTHNNQAKEVSKEMQSLVMDAFTWMSEVNTFIKSSLKKRRKKEKEAVSYESCLSKDLPSKILQSKGLNHRPLFNQHLVKLGFVHTCTLNQ